MNSTHPQNSASSAEKNIAEQLVRARLEARSLTEYPGAVPADIEAGYRCQDAAIALWPDRIGGWKSTMLIPASYNSPPGHERLVGPVFEETIRTAASGQCIDVPIFADGKSAIEPEIVAVIGRDAPPEKTTWTHAEARDMIGTLHLGAEVASTPLKGTHGLAALTSNFVMNFGIVQGIEIPGWRDVERISVDCYLDDKLIAQGTTSLASDPLDSLAFILSNCARRGRPLKAGMRILTGTLIPYHEIRVGQVTRYVYEGLGEVICRTVAAKARPK